MNPCCRLPACLLPALLALVTSAAESPPGFPRSLADLRVRDPFVHADPATGAYYLYAQTGNRTDRPEPGLGVEVYRSPDLLHWSDPALVFRRPPDFWGGEEIWAPEVHRFGAHWYLFVSFNGREGGRGTQILRGPSPAGPFTVFSPDANTPPDQRCLDGTPWVEPDGTPWLVYCHEWVQIGDGAMRAVRMRPDWSARVGDPIELFRASQAPWVTPLSVDSTTGRTNHVTDGPWLHRPRDGQLVMLWSSFGQGGYTLGLARSHDGYLDGRWTHDPEPLFTGDGGHGMLFRTFAGQLKLALHQPNHGGQERARFLDLTDTQGRLALQPQPRPAGYLFAHLTHQDYGRLRYALSPDGLHWHPLHGGQRILGEEYWGHPDLCPGHDGRFYLLGNRRPNRDLQIWTSTNLVHWTLFRDLPLDVSRVPGYHDNSGDHGAPKIFFDSATATYLITWHSSQYRRHPLDTEAYWRGQRTLFITSPDLQSFTEPRPLFPWDFATIDVIVRREGDRYFAFFKDETMPSFDWPTGKSVRLSSAPTLTGPWSDPSPPVSPNFREAPAVFPRPDGLGWYLYSEQYPGVQYTVATAPHLAGPWHELNVAQHAVPPAARHGCIIPLEATLYQALIEAFGRPPSLPRSP